MMVDDHLPGPDGESLNPDEVGSPRRTVLTFAGQAGAWLDELAQMSRESDAVRHLVDLTADFLTRMSERDAMAGSGVWARGIDVRPWFEGDRPDSGYLSHCSVSHPWIFATQIARWLTVRSDVLAHTEVIALTGHSQGVVPATFLAETTDLTVPQDRYLVWLEWLAWEGMHMQLAYKRKGATLHAEATPMAAIGRLPRLRLEPILARVNRGLAPDAQLSISLENTWDRTVISGPPESLVVLQDALGKLKSKDASDRRTPDPMPDFIWEWLAVSTPFHSRHMEPGLAPMRANLEEMAFKAVDKLAYTVLDPSNGEALPDGDARTEALLNSLFLEPVRWQTTMASAATLPGVTGLIDLGPGDGVARLTAATLRGTGLPVIAAATEAGRLHLAEGTTPHAVDWRPYAPRHITLPDGSTRIDNLWTRATGTPPVWLPGMTPTTVEVPLVAAAADAGYMAELAGGGQVTERHLRMRLDELAKTMKPGGRVVFNALYLDAYLWRLHLGEKKLVQKLAAAGAPLCGVTISAGIPPVDEAVALLEELEAVGLWMNAFKPGTVQQVDQVLRIAAQRPESTLFLHLEGGHAGGHHGWHGLEPVLLATYARIRRHRNVVLCVGGGVGDEARATELITGAWSQKYGVTRMPVDSVFLGTVTMACKEALTSPDVKRALVEAAGTPSWVKTHKVDGDITSGRSGLDADIYYLETSASRAGRLLDQVAGDADAAARRRDEIIEALSHTAKPYFGDLEAMTWHAVLNRIVELMAIGRNSPYEDGIWLDISWRQRFADALRRAEARVCDLDEGTFESRLQDPDLQDPHACVAGLLDAWPQIATHKLHPLDARWFVDSLCRRPGKPVPFVPVIDENVRKWYASDSLWQAHDPRYTADQVLAIPGPVAVSGIKKVDEPIGELLGRFVHGLTDALGEPAGRALRQPRLRTSSEGLTRGWTNAGLDIQAQEGATCWDAALTDVGGPVVDALLAEDGWAQGRRVPNPIRKLCEPRDGASLLIAEDGHTATWTFEDERVSLTASATGLTIAVHPRLAGEATVWSFDARLEGGAIVHDLDPSLAIFYPAALFGEALPEVPLFSTTRETVTVTPDRAEAYARVTGRVNPEGLASDLVFSLTWKPLFAALQACPEGMLRLVHLEHGVEVGPDGLPEPGESVEVSARLTRVEDGARGRTIHAIAQVDGGRRATLHAMFFVRGDASHTPWAVRALENRSETLVIDGAAREFLATHDHITLTGELTDRVMVEVELGETRHRDGRADGHAIGTLFNGETVLGHIEMKGSFEGPHPIGAMIDALKADEATDAATPPLTLATVQDVAPVNPAAFARIGRDYNPIHVSPVMARFADLDGPIVHGLWSAARCTAFVVDHAADGDATRITHSRVQFLAPVAPGSPIELKAVRRSLKDGARNIEVTLSTSEGIAVRGTWTVAPYKVAYVFPGQGIQRPGMGMDGYARSRAAKRVWEAADRVSRDKLGFSLLRVVRDNPTELRLPEGQVRHPEGVLHLTQFTQVAMATLAMAQIQELDEAGALIPGATFCGHSVGEYAALAAYGRVLPLEAVIELVWRRGLTMHTLVPRDEHGESGYRMGVVRPHHAGLPAEQVEGLLEEVRAETGGFVEIVNYNVRGRQYAVTGETKTLRVLEKRLMARQKGKKAPWLLVPGIDVPFHSTALVPGVDAFRDKLNRCMPQEVDVASLIGRYVPNLVARPFELTRPFALAILEVVDAQIVRDLLDRWDEAMADRNAVARILLIELLAWQFASPVRWIETQDLLLQPAWRKGLGLDTIIEIGVGYQPTLANMAKQTRVALGIDMPVLHVEADRDLVFSQDTDLPEPVAAPEVEASAEPAAAPVAEAAPAPVVAPTGPVGAPPEVAPGTAEVLRWMIALQSKRRLDQLSHLETLEEIFDGVSSRVNQLLLDVGQELGVGAIDGAAQLPLGELITTMESKVRYRGPGPYRTARHDAACAQVLGPCGWSKRDLEQHLATTFQFGEGLVSDALDELVTGTREGTSTAGGDLGGLPTRAADVAEAKALARQLAERLAARHGFGLAGPSTGGAAAAVDAEALNELRSELAGPQGVLTRAAQALGQMSLEETPLPESNSDTSVLEPEVERALQPAFHPEQHVALTSGWAWAHSAVVRYALHGEGDAGRLVTWGGDTAVGRTAAWYADRVPERQEMLEAIAAGGEARCVDWTPVRPGPEGDRPEGTRETFVRDLTERDVGHLATTWKDLLLAGADSAWSFAGRTALVTGAGPTSLATDVVRHLLRGGARVIVTTSSYRRARVALYQKLFAAEAGPGAELHIVPFNQASMTDISALISHLEGRGLLPDLLLPFAAIKDLGTLDTLGPRAEVALRAMLLGPERMIGGLAARFKALGRGDALQVIVPLSPNLGTFGGDGVYAETKAALQTLEAKWHSEHDAWGRHTSLVPVRIGWVRGTALMDANDSAAHHLEDRTGARTWSTEEMGFLIAGLCTDTVRQAARKAPIHADLTAGLGDVDNLADVMDEVRAELRAAAEQAGRVAALNPAPQAPIVLNALPTWAPLTASTEVSTHDGVNLDQMVVVCGFGEIGPWGSARTRWAREVDPELPAAAVLELAWITGLVTFENGQWTDVDSGDVVAEHELGARYREAVRERSGIRFVESEVTGYDPANIPEMATAWLDRDFTFNVSSAEEARAMKTADPDHTRVHCVEGQWKVTRKAGASVRVPRATRLKRTVAGQVPSGWDATRYGVPSDMVDRIDRAALFNLISTVEAFLSAGLTPEELLAKVHPTRVGSTQGSGIGGIESLRKLYVDPMMAEETSRDILQETLINVIASYAMQTYVGGYGPVSTPVAACATAAVSVEHAVEKILSGRADVVIAGGVDDIGLAGARGFANMGATADCEEMIAAGFEPDELSRANDERRAGFLEAHGGGAALIVRGDVALELGLPVYGVVAFAGSYTDGIHQSVPAPGLGVLGCVMGGHRSSLHRALKAHGLTADDIGILSKHDTSTGANDPNEAALHQRIQTELGRTAGNPLFVVSQKALTGHAKGGAASWQMHGLCQALATGHVPGNANLQSVDPKMRAQEHLVYNNETLPLGAPVKAGVLTSLGFGHIGAIVVMAHPDVWLAKVPEDARETWAAAAGARLERARRDQWAVLLGERDLYTKRGDRRLPEEIDEADLLVDPAMRMTNQGVLGRA